MTSKKRQRQRQTKDEERNKHAIDSPGSSADIVTKKSKTITSKTASKTIKTKTNANANETTTTTTTPLLCDHRYIVAPMVGASELPFRLLCRKYGAQLVYTPMMIASQFAASEEYRKTEFQTTPFDRPLVCHFAANDPVEFAAAAKLAEPHCDAIDLNLGCPQRTAYVGHFGSYLLDPGDRPLVLGMVTAASNAVAIPIFVKIRLLDTYEDTLELCRQLYDAGASLVAVHARYRASFHRKGPGARDGPALLDRVKRLRDDLSKDARYRHKKLITNGNTVTYEDVVNNLESTNADGIMSAEGILDNPALYLGRFGSRPGEGAGDDGSGNDNDNDNEEKTVEVKGGRVFAEWPKRKKWTKKLKKIDQQLQTGATATPPLSAKDRSELSKKKARLEAKLEKDGRSSTDGSTSVRMRLGELYDASDDKVRLALEYLSLARQYPATLRTIIFHTRRILKDELTTYQRMEECLACTSVGEVERLVTKLGGYRDNPGSFRYDVEKAKREKEALERKKLEEGKRKAYEARMIRKAKREKRDDLEYYLRQGAAVPTLKTVRELKALSKEEQLQLWKDRDHSQHCMLIHLTGECPRGRGCAFLHVASQTKTSFVESDEVAG